MAGVKDVRILGQSEAESIRYLFHRDVAALAADCERFLALSFAALAFASLTI